MTWGLSHKHLIRLSCINPHAHYTFVDTENVLPALLKNAARRKFRQFSAAKAICKVTCIRPQTLRRYTTLRHPVKVLQNEWKYEKIEGFNRFWPFASKPLDLRATTRAPSHYYSNCGLNWLQLIALFSSQPPIRSSCHVCHSRAGPRLTEKNLILVWYL